MMNFVEKHLSDKFYLQGTQRISLRDKIFREVIANNFEPFPKNPDLACVFTQIGHSEELGTGISNVYKYSKPYSESDKIILKIQ